jgi:hypothetical protein
MFMQPPDEAFFTWYTAPEVNASMTCSEALSGDALGSAFSPQDETPTARRTIIARLTRAGV